MVFKIGDQVKYSSFCCVGPHKLSGIIRSVLNEADIMNTQYLVEFEGWNKGHTGQGLKLINSFKTNVPNCWYCLNSQLELISSKPNNFEFELGQLVRIIDKNNRYFGLSFKIQSIYNNPRYYTGHTLDGKWLGLFSFNQLELAGAPVVICDDSIFKNKEMEESKMDSETIKTFNKNNLKAGKELAEKEKADYETQTAKEFYTTLITKKQNVERQINVYQEKLDEINKELSLFK